MCVFAGNEHLIMHRCTQVPYLNSVRRKLLIYNIKITYSMYVYVNYVHIIFSVMVYIVVSILFKLTYIDIVNVNMYVCMYVIQSYSLPENS